MKMAKENYLVICGFYASLVFIHRPMDKLSKVVL